MQQETQAQAPSLRAESAKEVGNADFLMPVELRTEQKGWSIWRRMKQGASKIRQLLDGRPKDPDLKTSQAVLMDNLLYSKERTSNGPPQGISAVASMQVPHALAATPVEIRSPLSLEDQQSLEAAGLMTPPLPEAKSEPVTEELITPQADLVEPTFEKLHPELSEREQELGMELQAAKRTIRKVQRRAASREKKLAAKLQASEEKVQASGQTIREKESLLSEAVQSAAQALERARSEVGGEVREVVRQTHRQNLTLRERNARLEQEIKHEKAKAEQMEKDREEQFNAIEQQFRFQSDEAMKGAQALRNEVTFYEQENATLRSGLKKMEVDLSYAEKGFAEEREQKEGLLKDLQGAAQSEERAREAHTGERDTLYAENTQLRGATEEMNEQLTEAEVANLSLQSKIEGADGALRGAMDRYVQSERENDELREQLSTATEERAFALDAALQKEARVEEAERQLKQRDEALFSSELELKSEKVKNATAQEMIEQLKAEKAALVSEREAAMHDLEKNRIEYPTLSAPMPSIIQEISTPAAETVIIPVAIAPEVPEQRLPTVEELEESVSNLWAGVLSGEIAGEIPQETLDAFRDRIAIAYANVGGLTPEQIDEHVDRLKFVKQRFNEVLAYSRGSTDAQKIDWKLEKKCENALKQLREQKQANGKQVRGTLKINSATVGHLTDRAKEMLKELATEGVEIIAAEEEPQRWVQAFIDKLVSGSLPKKGESYLAKYATNATNGDKKREPPATTGPQPRFVSLANDPASKKKLEKMYGAQEGWANDVPEPVTLASKVRSSLRRIGLRFF